MCGVVGLIGEPSAGEKLYPALFALQHRGQDAAGILSYDFDQNEFFLHKDIGLVQDVFSSAKYQDMQGSMALGHTRYSTIGSLNKDDIQPMFLSYPHGIGMVHNGNVTNYKEVVNFLRERELRKTFSQSDLELLLHMTGVGLADHKDKTLPQALSLSVQSLLSKVEGAYSVIGVLADQGLFAFCDQNGIRPLLIGRKKQGDKFSYCFSSEKQVFQVLEYEYWRDVRPGELIFIDHQLDIHTFNLSEKKARPCMFEWIYFAGSESEWHGRPMYEVRLKLGEILAEEFQKKMHLEQFDIDIVTPVPDTARTSAIRLAEILQKPYREVLAKNRYVQRSFITHQADLRSLMVNLKLLPIESQIKGKNILLVDDSVVRGTTSKRIVKLLKEAGAAKVYLASTCPAIRHACYYGIDFPRSEALVAHNKTDLQIADILGVDGIQYLPLNRLNEGIGIPNLCSACVDGDYVVPVNKDDFLSHHKSNLKNKNTSNEEVKARRLQ